MKFNFYLTYFLVLFAYRMKVLSFPQRMAPAGPTAAVLANIGISPITITTITVTTATVTTTTAVASHVSLNWPAGRWNVCQ